MNPTKKTRLNSGASEGIAVPAPVVVHVVFLQVIVVTSIF